MQHVSMAFRILEAPPLSSTRTLSVVLSKSELSVDPLQADIGRVEQGRVAREGARQLRHPARPPAVEPLGLGVASQQIARALALVQPFPLAHLQLRQPLQVPVLQQVGGPRLHVHSAVLIPHDESSQQTSMEI